jgi:hypothetical protein
MDTVRSNVSQSFSPISKTNEINPNANNSERLLKIAPDVASNPTHLSVGIEIPADEFREIVMFTLASNPDALKAIIEPIVRTIILESNVEACQELGIKILPGPVPLPIPSPAPSQDQVPSVPDPMPELPIPTPSQPRKKDSPARAVQVNTGKGTDAYKQRKSAAQRAYYDRKINGLVKPKTPSVSETPSTIAPAGDEVVNQDSKEDG